MANNSHLDAALQRAGWTPEQLAAAINTRLATDGLGEHKVHPKTPWKWLRGSVPHPPLPAYVAEVLSAQVGATLTPVDLGLKSAARVPAAIAADDGLDADYTPEGAARVLAEMTRRGASDPRRLTPLSGTSLTHHAHLWLVAPDPEVRDLAETLEGNPSRVSALRSVVELLRRVDDVEGGPAVAPWSAQETVTAMAMMRDVPDGSRGSMLQLVAELAELTGWAAVDSGRFAMAQRYLVTALHAAQAIGDREHGAYILALLGLAASLDGRHREAVTILESAQVGIRHTASLTVRSIVAGFEARVRAAAGDRPGFEATLVRATTIYERARVEDAPPWAYWAMEAAEHPMPLENGRGWAMVGHPQRAIEILTPKLDDLADYPRDVALVQAYLAEAHHLSGDQDQAALFVGLAEANLGSGVQSPRTAAVLAGIAG